MQECFRCIQKQWIGSPADLYAQCAEVILVSKKVIMHTLQAKTVAKKLNVTDKKGRDNALELTAESPANAGC